MKPKVVLSRRILQPGSDILEKNCEARVNPCHRALTKEGFVEEVKGVDGLLCLLTDTIDRGIMDVDLAKGEKVFLPERVMVQSHFSNKNSEIYDERSLNANHGF